MLRIAQMGENELNDVFEDIIYQLNGERRIFISRVYSLAISFLGITLIQVFPLILVDESNKFLRSQLFLFYLAAVVFIFVYFLYLFLPIIRKKLVYKIVLTVLMIESSVFLLSCWSASHELVNSAYALTLSVITFSVLTLIASLCPVDVTEYVVYLEACKAIVFLACLLLAMIYIFERIHLILIGFSSLLFLYISVFMVHTTQIIFGGRSARLETDLYHFAAFALYVCFVLTFLSVLPLFGPMIMD